MCLQSLSYLDLLVFVLEPSHSSYDSWRLCSGIWPESWCRHLTEKSPHITTRLIFIWTQRQTSVITLNHLLWVWTDSWWTLPVWEEHGSSVGPAEFWMQSQLWSHWDQVRLHRGGAGFLSSGDPFCPASLLCPPYRPGRHDTGSGQRCTFLLMSWPPSGPQCCQTPGQTLGCPWRGEYRKTSYK